MGELRAALTDAELIELCMLIGHYEMLAMTLNALRVQPDDGARGRVPSASFRPRRRGASHERGARGRRVLITGAARGIGAATARRLHERGARLALPGLEPELLAEVAADCGDAPWIECDVRDRAAGRRGRGGAVEGSAGSTW